MRHRLDFLTRPGRRFRPVAGALATCLVALLAFAPVAASASNVSVDPNTGEARVVAKPGERNDLDVVSFSPGSDHLAVYDAAGVKTGAGCAVDGYGIARCSGVVSVTIRAGDRSDQVRLSNFGWCSEGCGPYAPGFPTTIYGGPGFDNLGAGDESYYTKTTAKKRILGGPGNDTLTGGLGSSDVLLGQGGADNLDAKDGIADARISCGVGDDPHALFDIGIDPQPISC